MTLDELEKLPDSTRVNEEDAAIYLGVKKGTLSVWRCTDRYSLKYIKTCRYVRYAMGDLRDFIKHRTRTHTGEGQ